MCKCSRGGVDIILRESTKAESQKDQGERRGARGLAERSASELPQLGGSGLGGRERRKTSLIDEIGKGVSRIKLRLLCKPKWALMGDE